MQPVKPVQKIRDLHFLQGDRPSKVFVLKEFLGELGGLKWQKRASRLSPGQTGASALRSSVSWDDWA
ncbi:protein of unknown function [Candidatus Filomicrobium marinum]|uniref:Uncharacterized protein n=1 Tax=Candidatus Filomicrobium marinum TaxID=1608628 RepID=A0A0D6JHI3_9HYPH|nr:protein of unknown function [Candidatus Filomicrobium marinum]CPR20301.1 protein of unknown function [Candidatus Filomicrobium marinum]